MSKSSLTGRAAIVSIVLLAGFLLAWHLATIGLAPTQQMDPEYAKLMGVAATQGKSAMPGPLDVGAKLFDHLRHPFYDNGPNDKGIGWNLLSSLQRVGMGFGMAMLVGIPTGFVLGRFAVLNAMASPIISLLRPVSPLAWLPIGLMVFIGNVPLFILGWRQLGGRRFALRTLVAVAAYSFFADALLWLPFFTQNGLTNDLVLNSLYGGVLLGIGLGLVYRGKGTSGGTDILGRILNHRFGISISQSYLITDTIVIKGPGGGSRTFVKDGTGMWHSTAADFAKLEPLVDGTYLLRETDGLIWLFDVTGRLSYVEEPNGNRITLPGDGRAHDRRPRRPQARAGLRLRVDGRAQAR